MKAIALLSMPIHGIRVQKGVITVQDKVIDAIKRRLDENDIEMPYPTRTVLFHDVDKAGYGRLN